MNGGHYTALSKVEEIVLNDVLKQRYSSTNDVSGSGLASNGTVNISGAKKEGVYYDDVNAPFPDTNTSGTKLSLSEFIATSIPSGMNPSHADTNSNKTTAVSRWLKFDDEFVNVVPGANLHTNVVTGKCLCLRFYCFVIRPVQHANIDSFFTLPVQNLRFFCSTNARTCLLKI